MSSKITPHHTPDELARLARRREHHRIADRIHAIRLALEGWRPEEIWTAFGRTENWFFRWRRRYNQEGLEGLFDRPRPGQPKRLGDAERRELAKQIKAGPDLEEDGVSTWTGKVVQARIERRFGVTYSLPQVYALLHRLDFSWMSPRPKHPESAPETQKTWKEETYPSRSRKSKRRGRKRKSSRGLRTNRASDRKG
jgi:transposase